jgi:hypothetical protein
LFTSKHTQLLSERSRTLFFRAAIAAGHGAYLMEEELETPDVFSVSVGNLPAAAECIIKITYVTELTMDGDDIVFTIPATLAPSAAATAAATRTLQSQTRTVAAAAAGDGVGGVGGVGVAGASLQIGLDMPYPITRLRAASHRVRVRRAATKATVELLPRRRRCRNTNASDGSSNSRDTKVDNDDAARRRHDDGKGDDFDENNDFEDSDSDSDGDDDGGDDDTDGGARRDFVLRIRLERPRQPRMWVETHPVTGTRACLLTFYPPFDGDNNDTVADSVHSGGDSGGGGAAARATQARTAAIASTAAATIADIVFAVDRSASMKGSIDDARAVVDAMLTTLLRLQTGAATVGTATATNTTSTSTKTAMTVAATLPFSNASRTSYTFNILSFGSTNDRLFATSQPVTATTVAKARALAAALSADYGGSDVWTALRSAFGVNAHAAAAATADDADDAADADDNDDNENAAARNIIVVTDAQFSDEESVRRLIAANAAHTRVFCIGVGAAPQRHTLNALARVGGGTASIIAPGFGAHAHRNTRTLTRLLRRAARPALRDVRLCWRQTTRKGGILQAPRQVPALARGERALVYGFVDYCESVRLRARRGDTHFSARVDATGITSVTGTLIHTLAAVGAAKWARAFSVAHSRSASLSLQPISYSTALHQLSITSLIPISDSIAPHQLNKQRAVIRDYEEASFSSDAARHAVIKCELAISLMSPRLIVCVCSLSFAH